MHATHLVQALTDHVRDEEKRDEEQSSDAQVQLHSLLVLHAGEHVGEGPGPEQRRARARLPQQRRGADQRVEAVGEASDLDHGPSVTAAAGAGARELECGGQPSGAITSHHHTLHIVTMSRVSTDTDTLASHITHCRFLHQMYFPPSYTRLSTLDSPCRTSLILSHLHPKFMLIRDRHVH